VRNDKVEIIVLVDNNAADGLIKTHGLSIIVRGKSKTILFDTGPDPKILKYNADKLNVDLEKIDAVVLSHEHGDHTRGLSLISSFRREIPVFIPQHAKIYLSNEIRRIGLFPYPISETTKIGDGVFIVGELYGPPWEQGLMVGISNEDGILIVGCSHPGIENIAAKTFRDTGIRPRIIIGGFHLLGTSRSKLREIINALIKIGAKKILPLHCSGGNIHRLLKEEYSEYYEYAYAGFSLEI